MASMRSFLYTLLIVAGAGLWAPGCTSDPPQPPPEVQESETTVEPPLVEPGQLQEEPGGTDSAQAPSPTQ